MNETTTSHRRKPLHALFLSLAATGLGHVYCGRLAKGLVLFFVGFAFGPMLAMTAARAASTWTLVAALASIFLVAAVFVYAAVDAWATAKRTSPDYQLKEYNRWYIYLLFIVFAVTYPTSLANSIRADVMEAFYIPSASMEPAIMTGDYVLLNKARYKSQRPVAGDAVVFVNPNDRRLNFIKRIVAMPGDSVELRDGVLLVNDIPMTSGDTETTRSGKAYRVQAAAPDTGKRDFQRTVVPNGHCFVLGDNRGHSVDSRDFGPVPLAEVKGRVEYIYYPAGDWSRFGRFTE